MGEQWLPRVEPRDTSISIDEDWQARLLRAGPDKPPKALLANVIVVLKYAREFHGLLAFDQCAYRTMALKAPPWKPSSCLVPYPWTEEDDIRLAEWCQIHGIAISPMIAGQAVQAVAIERPRHPIRDYLRRVKGNWDREKRLDTLLRVYFGATEQSAEFTAAVGSRFAIGAVARVERPGCKNDCALILEGEQGIRKSSALRALGEPWFSDDIADIGSKDAQLQIRGTWIIEWSELDSMSRVEISRIKAFMSRSTDRFRPPYGHRLVELPRESVFCGSTNNYTYLRDDTGGRRFWPIRCGKIDLDALQRDKDQIWAEAVVRFEEGAAWWLDRKELEDEARLEQSDRYETGVWDDVIRKWVKELEKESTTVDEVLEQAIRLDRSKWTQAHRNHVTRALRVMGWQRKQSGSRASRTWKWWSPNSSRLLLA